MAIPHAYPGMPVDLRPNGKSLSEAKSAALVKEVMFEAIRNGDPQGPRDVPSPGRGRDHDHTLHSFQVPATAKTQLRKQLSLLGITDFTVYGDLESLSRTLKQAHLG
jgi:hypothetical protein